MNNSAAKASGCVSHRGNPHGGLLRVFFHLLICMAGVLGAYQASAQEGQVTPSAPQHFEPMPGDHAVTLVWTPPLNDGGSAVTGYEYRIDGDDWMTAGDDTVRRVTISDLNNGRLYQFEVRALNAMGEGDVAGPVTALPLGPHVEISITADTASVEEGSPAVFTLERIFNPVGNPDAGVGTTVAISVMVNTAETEHPQGTNSTKIVTDPPIPMQVEFDAGQQYATLSIPTEDDSLDEYDSVVTVMVTDDNAPGYRLPDPASGRMVSASVTVVDEDPPPNVSIAGGSATEMAGAITFAVSLDTASGLPVSVDWSTDVAATPSEGTDMATADEDYESASGTVNFPAGETEMTIRVVLIDDGLDEHREEFVVTLGNPMNAVPGTETATGAIEDDDEPPTISIADASGGESDGALMFAVSLDAPSGLPVTVDWSTDVAATPSQGSDMATADEDYESASGTVNFPAGETEMTIRVVLIDDGLDEHREEFVVTLGNPMNAVPGTETATGAIEDDDEPPTISIADASGGESDGPLMFAVSLDAPSGLPVTVDWSTDVAATPSEGADMATAGEDYESASGTLNFPAGETEMTIRVVLIDDGLDEHREEFVVTLGNPMNAVPGTETATGAIEDDDEPPTISIAGASGGESDGPLMFAVSLGAPSGRPVTVDWSTDVAATPSQGSDMATADEDYESASGTLNFPAGETEMTIPVVLIDDELDEHREEFVVTLGNPMYAVPVTETATGAIEDDDEPPTISIADASGGESDGALMFAVSLDAPSGLPVTVDWSTDVAATPSQGSDMATADEDYESASGTVNFPAGETEMTIRVVLIDDGLDEHREEFVVTLGNPMNAVPGTETATGAIEDDDEPPTISIAGASGGESDGPLMFAVSLDAPSGLPVTVDWSTDVAATPSEGADMATAGEDYESASGTLNFPAGETEMTIRVVLIDDGLDEHREEFVVTLGNPMYAVPGTETATGAIEDDDEPPTISIAGASGGESDGALMFAVSLGAPSGRPVTVDWSTDVAATTSQGSDMATADEDYESASGTLNFPAGETEMTIRVVLIDDGLDEHREEFVVTLGNPMYAVPGTETATGAIEDDDEPPTISIAGASAPEMVGEITFAVSLDTASGLPVSVDWSTDVAATPTQGSDMATADEDYESASGTLNFPAGETEMTIRVVLIDDGLDEHREEFVVTLGNPMYAVPGTETATGAIEDDDEPPTISIAGASGGESDGPLMFAVSLDAPSGLPVTVDWSTDVAATPSEGADMATAGEDYESASGTLNFPAGETEMTIRVVLIDDGLDEHREEFVVTLGNPMYAVPGTETATGAIEDDDEPPTISIAGASGGESDGALMFAVSLGAPSGLPVTVDWSTDVAATPSQGSDMATADEDYESASGTLNFPAGETEMTIRVVLIDDGLDEHREEFVVTLGNPMYAVLGTETATGAIEDVDEPPTISIAGASAPEMVGEITFAVSLDTASGLPVSVDWSTDVAATPSEGSDMATADEDYESASGTLNFPAGETEMTIRVVVIDDGLDEHREEFVVTLGNPMYAVPGTETATGAIEDDDEPPTISIAGASGGESDGPLMFAVSLGAPSGLPVTVDWSTDVAATPSEGSDMATAGEDYESASGTLNFPAGETEMTIRVVLIEDGLVEIREEFVVTLGNPVNAVLGTETATGVIEGDDEPTISIAGASGGESDGPLMFAVSLGAPSVLRVTVDWSTGVAATPSEGADMATADEDYESASGTLNFPAGETEMTIRVVLIDDGLDEHREEFVVTFGNAVHGILETETATGAIEDDDEPPTISIADASGGESDGALMFAVSLDAPSGLPVTVDWSTDVAATPSQGSDMATADEDYESASGTLNFPAGETEMTIPVVLIDDGLDEHREEFVVTLGNPMYAVLGTETATGAIEDVDKPPTISIVGASGGESDGALMFAVSLGAPSGLPVTVDWSTDVAATPSEGSDMATADEDYESASGTLNFPAGETEMTIRVVLIDDGLDERREEFVVTLGNPMYAVPGTETATGAIEDDDEPPTISIAGASAPEMAGEITFAVSLDTASGLPVSVDWSTDVAATPSEGSDMATAGEDYESASGTLNFPAGETEMTIRVVLIEDGLVEIREEFVVTLGNPMYAVLGTETATGAIEGDDEPTISIADASGGESDGPLMFAVSLGAPSVLRVTVDWSTGVAATPSEGADMATADEDYESASGTLNFPAGETEMTIPVVLIDDGLDEHREELVVTLGNPMNAVLGTETATGAIEDDDEPPTISIAGGSGTEMAGEITFAVSLDTASGLPVSVDWSTDVAATPSEGSDMATADEDYESASGTLNFPAGETEMTIPVVLVNDELDEHREEFVVTLSNPMYAVLETETATGVIEDDDEPPTISIADASGGESDGPLMFAVSLDRPSGLPVTVDFATAPGSAVAGEDFEAASGALTIPAGDMSGMVVVNVVADDVHEATETFSVMLSGAMYGTLADATATGTITDDDEPPTLAVADTTAAESAGRIDFTVTLTGATALPATVAWATSPGTADAGDDYTTSSGSLSFAPGETSMSFSVPVVSDALYEGSETFTVTLSGSTNSTLSVATATGTITDDDAEGVVKQWLSRFGRTVADHVVEALDARLYQTPGQTASQLTLGGLRVDVDRTVGGPFGETFSLRPRGSDLGQLVAPMHSPAFNPAFDAVWDDRARRPWGSQRLRNPGVGDVLSRSSFHYGAAADGATGDAWALWGRVATTSFSGDDGVLSHDGDVTTGTVGVDFERGDALFGVALSFSEGEGEFQGSSSGLAGGNLDSSVTLVNPYVRVMINACTSVWGLVGFGGGEMTLAAGDGGVPIETDMEMTLGAAGFRVVLQHKLGNFDVATRGDAFLAQTSADAAPGLESVDADASRMRFALEATNVTELEGGGLFTPILEAGVRYDGGDAETGAGMEVGGGLRYADASGRVSLQVNARALLAHKESYQEWGLGASVLVRPDTSGQGVTFNLRSTWGDIANGVDALWNGRDAGLAAAGLGTRYGARHDAEVGYGLNAPGGRNVLVPYIGVGASDIGTRDYRLGVRLRSNSTMNLSVEVDRREGFGPDPDHGVVLRGWLYW